LLIMTKTSSWARAFAAALLLDASTLALGCGGRADLDVPDGGEGGLTDGARTDSSAHDGALGEGGDAGKGDATTGDGGTTHDGGAPGEGGVDGGCATGRDCNGTCVDVASDPKNCGGCGIACGATQVCSQGQCTSTCATGLTSCSGACVDLTSDPQDCGA
jgi:hypothetical protein